MSDENQIKNREFLLVLHDKDVFSNPLDARGVVWKDRLTGKVVLCNKENHIALIGNKVNNLFLLPGGGVEGSESVVDGTKRECREETGCEINILDMLGMTEDFRARDSRHCITHGYLARVSSYGTPALTDNEKDAGVHVSWISLDDAIDLFASQEKQVKAGKVSFYNTAFNILRDGLFVRRAKEVLQDKVFV